MTPVIYCNHRQGFAENSLDYIYIKESGKATRVC